MNRNDLGIIIVNYGGGSSLADCLDSFIDRTDSYSEIIVVDNASPPESADFSRIDRTRLRWIQLAENRGYGAACNTGARLADSGYLLFLNNDTLVDPDLLVRMIHAARENAHEVSGCFGCILTDRSGAPVHSFGRYPGLLSQLSIWKNRLSGGRDEIRRLERLLRERGRWIPVDYVTGAALAVSRDSFIRSGGFDERFFLYFEETELQYRMMKMGLASRLYSDSGIVHLQGGRKLRSNRTRIITYDSLVLYKRITLGTRRFKAFRLALAPLVMLQICNTDFSFSENREFVAATLRALFDDSLVDEMRTNR